MIQKNNNRIVKIILLFVFVIFFSQKIYSANYQIHGLETRDGGNLVYCNYNSQTNNCVLSGGDYNITASEIKVNNLRPNLVIDGAVWLSRADNISPNLIISDFNSIRINPNKSLQFNNTIGDLKIKTNIYTALNSSLLFNIHTDYYDKCIDLSSDDLEYSDAFTPPDVDFSESKIYNDGNFIFKLTTVVNANSRNNSNENCNQNLEGTELTIIPRKIKFNNIKNTGVIELFCATKKGNNSNEDITISEPSCNIFLNNYTGKLPKTINFNYVNNSPANYGRVFLETCGPISIPSPKTYTNICSLIYTRPETGILDLNQNNTGINTNNIIKFTKNCNYVDIHDEISNYLFVDVNQTISPFVFGNIKKANSGQIINPNFINYGLFDLTRNDQNYSAIQNTKNNNFFIFKLIPNKEKTLDILKFYQFKFRLDANADLNYTDINLSYPFKIYK